MYKPNCKYSERHLGGILCLSLTGWLFTIVFTYLGFLCMITGKPTWLCQCVLYLLHTRLLYRLALHHCIHLPGLFVHDHWKHSLVLYVVHSRICTGWLSTIVSTIVFTFLGFLCMIAGETASFCVCIHSRVSYSLGLAVHRSVHLTGLPVHDYW